jgi:hypothetical protein
MVPITFGSPIIRNGRGRKIAYCSPRFSYEPIVWPMLSKDITPSFPGPILKALVVAPPTGRADTALM